MYKNWKTSLIGLVVAGVFVGVGISVVHVFKWIRANPIWFIGVCILIINVIFFVMAYGKED